VGRLSSHISTRGMLKRAVRRCRGARRWRSGYLPSLRSSCNSHGLENVPSLSYRENGNFINNPAAPLVWNLDELPMPDFSIFNYKVLISTKTNVALGMLSRGCPYNCTYCSNRAFRSVYPNPEHYHRSRSPEGAIEYIEQLRSVILR